MITLGDLIEILESLPASASDLTLYGWGGLHSWRGSYNDLSLSDGSIFTIKDALHDCLAAVDTEFYGYKGGSYYMTKATPVWGDNYGECPGYHISGVAFVLDKENKTNPIAKILRSVA